MLVKDIRFIFSQTSDVTLVCFFGHLTFVWILQTRQVNSTRCNLDREGVQQPAGSVHYPAFQQVTWQRAVSSDIQAWCSTAAVEHLQTSQSSAIPVNAPGKAISERLRQHMKETDGIPKHQLAYRRGHSTENALLKVIKWFITVGGEVTALCLLNLSTAFDTVDHQVLISRLQGRFGVVGKVPDWFQSHLHGWIYSVTYGSLCLTSCI